MVDESLPECVSVADESELRVEAFLARNGYFDRLRTFKASNLALVSENTTMRREIDHLKHRMRDLDVCHFFYIVHYICPRNS